MTFDESNFRKIIDRMIDADPSDLGVVSEFIPSSLDQIGEQQDREEEDSKEIFTVAIKNREDIEHSLVNVNREGTKKPVIAVDSSSTTLAKTEKGMIAAIKAAAIFGDSVETFGPFIYHITNENKHELYNQFMRVFDLEGAKNIPILTKMPDRIRNFLERLVQRYASHKVNGAMILWDGSLGTKKSQFDTPENLMQDSLSLAAKNNNDVVAVTKKTNLILSSNESIFSVLSEFNGPAFVDLTGKIAIFDSKTYNILGDTFAAKFTYGGIPFRVDVKPHSEDPSSVLIDLIRSTSFYHGYPVELRNAHIYSKITKQEAIACQRMIATKYSIPIIDAPDLHRLLLSPYG